MKKYMISFFAAVVLSFSASIGAWSWQGIRNNTILGVKINLRGSTQQPILPAGQIIQTSYHGHSGEFAVYSSIYGWFKPDYQALEDQVIESSNKNENIGKRPVVYIGTGYTGGWDFRIVWEDNNKFNTNKAF